MPAVFSVMSVAVQTCAAMQGDVRAHVSHWKVLDSPKQKRFDSPNRLHSRMQKRLDCPKRLDSPKQKRLDSPN